MKKRSNGNGTADLIRLAQLKSQMKELEKEVKELQEKILAKSSTPEKFETDFGVLKIETRRNYSIPDNNELIKKSSITKEIFINTATISMTKVKTICGDAGFVNLIEEGVIEEKDPTRFFKLV